MGARRAPTRAGNAMAALNRNNDKLEIGSIVRNLGDGGLILQVKSLGQTIILVSAGRVVGGTHSPPKVPQEVEGYLVEERPPIVWTGEGLPTFGKIGSAYIHVTPSIPLTGLALPQPSS